jgi:transcriptional regulator with XRE-family HTH domain
MPEAERAGIHAGNQGHPSGQNECGGRAVAGGGQRACRLVFGDDHLGAGGVGPPWWAISFTAGVRTTRNPQPAAAAGLTPDGPPTIRMAHPRGLGVTLASTVLAIASGRVQYRNMASLNVGNVGEYLRDQRRNAQLSLRQLAEAAGVSNPYLSQIERGLRKPSAEILQQLARALRISAETLYVQAGILDERDRDGMETRGAILADPAINERQKQVLLQIYDSFRKENGADDDPSAAAPGKRPARPAVKKAVAGKAVAKKAAAKKAAKKAVGAVAVLKSKPTSPADNSAETA